MRSSAATTRFRINDREFFHYRAQDSHGSACRTCMVDGEVCSGEVFGARVIDALGSAAAVLYSVFAIRLALSARRVEPAIGQLSWKVDDTTFGLTVAGERPTWRSMIINGEAVSYKDFHQAIEQRCHQVALVVRDQLACLQGTIGHSVPSAEDGLQPAVEDDLRATFAI